MPQLVAVPISRFELWILRRPRDGGGRIETQRIQIEASSGDQAIAQGRFLAEAILEGWTGVAMLTNEAGALIWSTRRDMPPPTALGMV